MKNNRSPDPSALLHAVMGDQERDTLAPLLQAVRARRRRRQLGPVAAVVVLAAAWIGTGHHYFWKADLNTVAAAPIARPTPDFLVRSTRLDPAVVVHTSFAPGVSENTRGMGSEVDPVHTRHEVVPVVSDNELLALAGGQGVGLFRSNGHTELLTLAEIGLSGAAWSAKGEDPRAETGEEGR